MVTPIDFLDDQYNRAMSVVGSNDIITSDLEDIEKLQLNTILEYSESKKAVLTVFITSVVYKVFNPNQDIRNHQVSIADGYSGRSFDNKYITPFLKRCKFPAMAESGWLTRSFENKTPYDQQYTGAITPKGLKLVFLELIDNVETQPKCIEYLSYILQGLIIKRNLHVISLARPTTLSIKLILEVLDIHFHSTYNSIGSSRLPVLAFYAVYECLIKETKRFENKRLVEIESHLSADARSGRIGDIEIIDEQDRSFEAVEVKHGIPISLQIVLDAYSKFQTTPVDRYYILSTADKPSIEHWNNIQDEIQRIKNVHGCQVIVNGIMPSLKYYLRLLNDPFEFINNYVNLIEKDTALKFEHRVKWNKIISDLK